MKLTFFCTNDFAKNLINYFLTVVDGLVGLLTLTAYCPELSMRWLTHTALISIRERRESVEKVENTIKNR